MLVFTWTCSGVMIVNKKSARGVALDCLHEQKNKNVYMITLWVSE